MSFVVANLFFTHVMLRSVYMYITAYSNLIVQPAHNFSVTSILPCLSFLGAIR